MSRPFLAGLLAWAAAAPLNPPPRARAIIDLFERTAKINRLFLSGQIYESNLERSAFLRQNVSSALARVRRLAGAAASRAGVPSGALLENIPSTPYMA